MLHMMRLGLTLALFIVLPDRLISGAPQTKYSYKLAGSGASADIFWVEGGCDSLTSYASIFGQDQVYRVKEGSGKPDTTPSKYAYFHFNVWTDCSPSTATRTYLAYAEEGLPPAVVVDKSLASAVISGTFQGYLMTETCGIACETFDGYEYCYLSECVSELSETSVEITFQASFVATGVPEPSTQRDTSRSSSGYSYRYSSNGKSRSARLSSFSAIVGGDTLQIPAAGLSDAYATIQSSTRGELVVDPGFV